MYLLNNVTVSGTHYVYHNTLKWIQVHEHPDAVLLENYITFYKFVIFSSNSSKHIIHNVGFLFQYKYPASSIIYFIIIYFIYIFILLIRNIIPIVNNINIYITNIPDILISL